MSLRQDVIWQILQDRSRAIVDDWYSAIKGSSLSSGSPSEARQLLSRLLERIFAFLASEATDLAEARAIGAGFVPFRLEPDAFGRIQDALMEQLLGGLPADLMVTLRPRLTVLIEGLAAGVLQADRATVLAQQERIRDAYVQALRRAEEELLLKDASVESSINAICFCSPEGQVIYVNAAFLSMWGYDLREDVVGRDIGVFWEWEYQPSPVVEVLEREDGWIGEVVARRHDGSRFDVLVSASTVRGKGGHLLQIVGSFVDITERKRAQETLQRRAAQLVMLNQIGDRIAALLRPDEVVETAVRLVQETFDYHQVAVLTLDREQEELVVAATACRPADGLPDGYRLPLEEGISGWVARHGKALVANDVEAEPRYIKVPHMRDPIRSELAVPIQGGGNVIGVLDVQSPQLGAFGEGDRIALETVADQIAVALENARLYEALKNELAQRRRAEASLRRNVQRLNTLHDIDRAILGASSMEEVAEAALHRLQRLVPCQRASIDLFDQEAGEVIVFAAIQTVGEGLASAGVRFPFDPPRGAYEVLQRDQVAYVRDVRELPQTSPFVQAVRDDGLRSFIGAPIRYRGELIGTLALGADRVDGFEPEHGPILEEVADSLAVAIQQARLLDSVRRHGERLRDTMIRLAEAEEAERRRVVHVLHDRVGQDLTALDLNLSLVRSQLAARDLQDLCARLDRALSLVEETNARIRQLMADLRPPALDDYGLLATLRWYAEQFSSRMGIEVSVRGDQAAAYSLPPHVENALFRIAQEALHNTAKHAQATQATVDLSPGEAAVQLTISDNGTGFAAEKVPSAKTTWGLLTMRERAESVGARCVIQSSPGQGTRVVVEVPR